MKNNFLICLLAIVMMNMTSCNAAPSKNRKEGSIVSPDSVVCKELGKTLSEILFNPSKVKVYSLKGVEKVDKDDVEIEDHFVRDTLIATLDEQQIAILQFLLLSSEENYKNDSTTIRAPYLPQLEFEFVKKKNQVAHVVISVNDRTWTVVYDDKVQFNWNYANKGLVARFCDYFINVVQKNKGGKK